MQIGVAVVSPQHAATYCGGSRRRGRSVGGSVGGLWSAPRRPGRQRPSRICSQIRMSNTGLVDIITLGKAENFI